MTSKTFSDLALCEPLLRSLKDAGFETPTPVQQQSIPLLLDGRDLVAIAQTGTGKTAAFSLPILHHLREGDRSGRRRLPAKTVRTLILAPTRELAVQIGENIAIFTRHLKMKQAVIVGGVGFGPQRLRLAKGVDILVATPGRLLDLIEQNAVSLERVSHFVLDEADRMLDMGFIHDVRKVAAMMPKERQSLLFSATMPPKVEQLARFLLDEPARVEVTPETVTVDRITQTVHHVETPAKKNLLLEVMANPDYARVIVFTRTKHKADRISRMLTASGIESEALHGDKTQGARQRALKRFKGGAVRALVATDIAARGIDVSDVSHVINFELPNEPESYVHRIGRTARAGTEGAALSLCAPDEYAYLQDIEELIGQRIEVVGGEAPEKTVRGGQKKGPARPAGRNRTRPPRPDGKPPADRNAGANKNTGTGKSADTGKATGTGKARGKGAGKAPNRTDAQPPRKKHEQKKAGPRVTGPKAAGSGEARHKGSGRKTTPGAKPLTGGEAPLRRPRKPGGPRREAA